MLSQVCTWDQGVTYPRVKLQQENCKMIVLEKFKLLICAQEFCMASSHKGHWNIPFAPRYSFCSAKIAPNKCPQENLLTTLVAGLATSHYEQSLGQ